MPTVAKQKSPGLEDRFVTAFEAHEGRALNGRSARINGLRREAIDHFRRLGFPARRAEAWKYTNIGQILKREYALSLAPAQPTLSRDALAPFLIPDLDVHLVVLVNGRFREDLSAIGDLPDGVVVTGLAEAGQTHTALVDAHFGHYADAAREPFVALNTAFTQDGVFVYVPKSRVVEKPVHVVSLLQAEEDLFVQPRALFVVEAGGMLRLIETSGVLGDTPTFTNVVKEAFVGAGAHVDHYDLQDDGPHASQVTTWQAYQEHDSVFRTSTFTFGGEVVRNNLNLLPDGTHCESHLYGLFLGRGRMHVDSHTVVDHAKPDCFSNELYKGILDDHSTGVFNGRVLVRQDAQKINAYQSNQSIVLTETADMFSKPELEIYADDVRCSHGATTGQLDEEALFYLRSRGIPERKARALLLTAFARDVIENVAIEPLRAYLDAMLVERFH